MVLACKPHHVLKYLEYLSELYRIKQVYKFEDIANKISEDNGSFYH